MHLTLEGELKKMVDLGKKIQGDIGLPEPNIVTLIQESVPKA
jgi:hypothetical protein